MLCGQLEEFLGHWRIWNLSVDKQHSIYNPTSAQSESCKLWLSHSTSDPQDQTLGLSGTATQIFWGTTAESLTPFILQLPLILSNLLDLQKAGLPGRPSSTWSRRWHWCYEPSSLDLQCISRGLHAFSDALERVYDSIAYHCLESQHGQVSTAFIMARSRVAPKK